MPVFPIQTARISRRPAGDVGFTMIELMITLAIIGILVTVAIPSFLGFRSRAYQAEMKTNLTALYRAEKIYYSAASHYTDNIASVDWRVEGAPIYLYGFTSDTSSSGVNDSAELAASTHGGFSTVKMVDGAGLPLSDSNLPSSPLSSDAFTAGAVGNVDDDMTLDRWTLDSSNTLTLISTDIGG